MRIGIKYCGGCNPYYDRGKAAAVIKAAMHGYVLASYESGEVWDTVIVICGCTTACASVDESEKAIYISSEQDVDKALYLLRDWFVRRDI